VPTAADAYFGALEHASSSTYRTPYETGPGLIADLGPTISHEFFHAWSPKRIHVAQLGPFDYQAPPRTTSLWLAEGITEYYSRIIPLRTGMLDSATFLRDMQNDIRASYGRPQRISMTHLSDSISFLDPGLTSSGLYSKGPVIALLLDAAIRQQTNNESSLDDAMRYLNEHYGRTGTTFTDEEIIPIMERATGTKLDRFYRDYIDGRKQLPIDSLLPVIGLTYAGHSERIKGVGAEFSADNGFVIASVTPGGTFDAMGIRAGDTIRGYARRRDSVVVYWDGSKKPWVGAIRESVETVRLLRPDPEASEPVRRARRAMLGF
jgi:predicted metalloprotease with PDZ domain